MIVLKLVKLKADKADEHSELLKLSLFLAILITTPHPDLYPFDFHVLQLNVPTTMSSSMMDPGKHHKSDDKVKSCTLGPSQ